MPDTGAARVSTAGQRQGNNIVLVIRKWGYAWILLEKPKRSLQQIHRRFSYPLVNRLHKVLQRAGHGTEILNIKEITKFCRHCQLNSKALGRFKFTLRDDHEFNYKIHVDVVYLDSNKPALHVVDSATAFNATRFLCLMCWIDVYLGLLDWIVKEVLIEAHNSVGKVERYYAALRRAYVIIRAETSVEPKVALQIAVKVINDTTSPNGLMPTLLVFGAMEEVQQIHAERQVNDALTAQNGPDTTQGPYSLIANNSTTCTVDLLVTAKEPIKPVQEPPAPAEVDRESITIKPEEPIQQRRGHPRKNLIPTFITEIFPTLLGDAFLTAKEEANYKLAVELRWTGVITTPGKPFKQSNNAEIDGLAERGEHAGTRIFKSRLVREVKGKNKAPYEKSRLVIQGYADDGKTITPSLLRDRYVLWLRDITQAYTQSTTDLNRVILAHLPVIRPLYGIPEAGTHWWATYNSHHTKSLQIDTSTFDPCLLVSAKNNNNFALIGIQTNNTIGLTNKEFSDRKETTLKEATFTAKPKQFLTTEQPLTFNGGVLFLRKRLQPIEIGSLQSHKQYVEQRARGAYIASVCQPEACFDYSIKALNRRIKWQIENIERGLRFIPLNLETAKLFVFVDRSFANNADLTSQLGFIVILANEDSNDSIEQSTKNTGEFTVNRNIVHFSSTKCKRVTRSVLTSEIYAMVAGADIAHAIGTTLALITERLAIPPIPTVICTDSYSLYECLVKLGTTKEKRLIIDIMAIRQSFTKSSPNSALEALVSDGKVKIRING
ncbi:hypothetical protein LX36DRAFT_677081 [Colletotrichum falcatum]|nr:hypothetical protein LX36DRAFT_677081 [Colletotrichum falcatum]